MRSKQKVQAVMCVALCATMSITACGGASDDANPRDANARALATPESTRGDSTAAVSAVAARPRVVILGTSLTAGLGLDPSQAYPTLLQQKADSAGVRLEIVNAGLSGETSAGALRRAAWVLDQPAAAVILEVGANDGLRGVNPDSTYANLMALVQTIRSTQPGARLALVQMEAPTNLGRDYTTRFHTAFERAAKDANIPLLPFLLDRVAGDARFNQGDGIHPNREGSVRVADNMWRALQPLIAEIQLQ